VVQVDWTRDWAGELTLGDMMGRSESRDRRGIVEVVVV
jgi:hypothetical protein